MICILLLWCYNEIQKVRSNMREEDIINLLKYSVSKKCSDIHLHVGEKPIFRINGTIERFNMGDLTDEDIENAIRCLMPKSLLGGLTDIYDIDFSYDLKGLSRFRVNVARELNHLAMTLRLVPYDIQPLEQLNLPECVNNFTAFENGLILVTGPTGSGKSTTIASILDYINKNSRKHIITLEDPIEFVYKNHNSIVSQRQIGIDTQSFASGLKYALRQDPDVISIGEIRDLETITSALNAAETGHLVFATIHTNSAVQTINRIINFYDPSDREYIRMQLANILRGTISQKLLPSKEGNARFPACEVLVVTPTVKDYIQKNNSEEIVELMERGKMSNMITLNKSLFELVQSGKVSQDVALSASYNPVELAQKFRGSFHGTGI